MSSSVSVDVVKVTDENRDALRAMIRGMYEAEGCGVCEKSGADVCWFSPISRCAHSVCYGEIKTIEADLITTINSVFEDNSDRNMAHVAATRAVRKELGGVSIKTFLDANGASRLKSIFDSVGVDAVKTYSSKY